MKKQLMLFAFLIAAFGFMPSTHAGVGGTSGTGKFMWVQVCGGESGLECSTVRIENRFTEEELAAPKDPMRDCLVAVGAAQMVPCSPEVRAGIPALLQKLNSIFPPNSQNYQDPRSSSNQVAP